MKVLNQMRSLQNQLGLYARLRWMLSVGIVALLVGFYALGYRQISGRMNQLTEQIESKQRELDRSESRASALPEVEREVNRIRTRLERFNRRLPRSAELGEFVKQVTDLAKRASLQNLEVQPQAAVRNEHFSEMPFRLSFQGEFPEVFEFLKQAEEMPRLTRVREMEIESRGVTSGKVSVRLTMHVYFLGEQ